MRVESAKRSLITHCAALQRGLDGLAQMIRTRRRKQNGFGMRPERLRGTGQQHVPDRLRARRAARLAAHHHAQAERLQALGQLGGLGRLSAPLAAFKCDEFSGH